MKEDVRHLIRDLLRRGWRIEEGRKHYKAIPPVPGATPVPIPKTPSDHRWKKNAIRDLRKYGYQPPEKGKKGKKGRKR